MVKDSKRFGDVGTTPDQPPQANDAKCGVACGVACHTIAKSNDYVFTAYGHR
jgi:hypothetical protein